MKKLSFGTQLMIYIGLLAGALLFTAPLAWMISTALKPLDQTMEMPPTFLPYEYRYHETPVKLIAKTRKTEQVGDAAGKAVWAVFEADGVTQSAPAAELTRHWQPRWSNFSDAIRAMKYFPRYLYNTILLCFLTVIGTVVSSALAAYGFSRIEWKGRDRLFLIALGTMMIPFPVVMVPLYCLYRQLGLIGTLTPLWIGSFGAGAFNVFLLRQFFLGIPKSLSEAARIDGCSEFGIFWRVILPVSKPALMVVGLFQFMATWNDFLGPLLYLTDQKDYTLALGLQFFQSQSGGTDWNFLMAASTLIVLPVIILFFFTQKSFIEGISTSGIKG